MLTLSFIYVERKLFNEVKRPMLISDSAVQNGDTDMNDLMPIIATSEVVAYT